MSRVWARIHNDDGTRTWQAIETTSAGSNDNLNFIWLQNVLLLNINESPFYSDWGVPVHQTMVSQILPDYYMSLIQRRFSEYFASVIINRISATTPTYSISVTSATGFTATQKYSQAQT